MSEQPPINDERSETPAPLPTIAESVIREDLERIRKRKLASTIGCWVLLVLFCDLVIVSGLDYGVHDRTAWADLCRMGRFGHARRTDVYIYDTPQGWRVMPAWTNGHSRSGTTLKEDPPPLWRPVAWAAWFPVGFRGYGHGLITPFKRECEYRLLVTNAEQDKDLPADDWRQIVCDWLEMQEPEYGKGAIATAQELRKGDHIVRSLSLPLLLHDIVFVIASCLSVGVIIDSAIHRTSRSARRIHRGHCPRCSYDLLSNFSRGCPECAWGNVPPA